MKQTKKWQKIGAIALSGTLGLATLAGCNTGHSYVDSVVEVDETKTQIEVGNFYGGLSDEWLRELAKQFETKYAEKSFEPTKKGVQVMINNQKASFIGSSLISTVKNLDTDVFFTEGIVYYDWVSSGLTADITDIVTNPLTEYGENVSIEDKMDGDLVEYFKTSEGKYYALPFYDAFMGIYYDVDLFEENNLYFAAGKSAEGVDLTDHNAIAQLFIGNPNAERANGPDGMPNTDDDGLPATYADFYALMNRMKLFGITPFVWTGAYPVYLQVFASSVWADAAGAEEVKMNFELEGTATNLISVNNGVVTRLPDVTITEENGYELQKSESRYQALQFMEKIVRDSSNFSDLSFSGSLSNLSAQEEYLYSKFASTKTTIAMLLEGTWWEMESRAVFNDMAISYGPDASHKNRRIGLMPMPKPTVEALGVSTWVSTNDSACFINKNSKGVRLEVAKEFLRFVHTNNSLATFNQIVSMTRPYDYVIDETQYEDMSYFAKSVYEAKQTDNIIYPYSGKNIFIKNSNFFKLGSVAFSSIVNGAGYNNPLYELYNMKNLKVEDYFNGLYTNKKDTWPI